MRTTFLNQNDSDDNIAKLRNLIINKLQIAEEVVITDTLRLGTRTAGKTRLLRFTLQDAKIRKQILRKATTLRTLEEGDECHNVYIKPDLTPIQVEASKNLVIELKETRRKEPLMHWKIYKGKITQVNESGHIVL